MKLLRDENVPVASTYILRQQGYELESVSETMFGSADSAILRKAAIEQSLILTHDRDYGELLYKHQLPKPLGIVYPKQQPLTPTESAELFLKLTIPIVGFHTTVERDRVRQRPI